jgi:DNA primase
VALPEKHAAVTRDLITRQARDMLEEGWGFDDAVVDAWQLGVDPLSDRISIPARDEYHRLVGFKGRATRKEQEPKYLVLGGDRYGFIPYEVSKTVFGMNRAIANEATADLVVVEGEFDCIAMHQKGFTNTVAMGSANFSEHQRDIIRRYADTVTVFFDDDEGGHSGVARLIRLLEPFMPVRVVGGHEGDPPKMSREAIQEALDSRISSVTLSML